MAHHPQMAKERAVYLLALEDWSAVSEALFTTRNDQAKLELAYELANFNLELAEAELEPEYDG